LSAGNIDFSRITTLYITMVINAASSPPQIKLANPYWTNGTWTFNISGPSQTNYIIWSSTNLAQWFPLKTNFSSAGNLQFTNPSAPPAQFYRASFGP
jgi:hypothetical protein